MNEERKNDENGTARGKRKEGTEIETGIVGKETAEETRIGIESPEEGKGAIEMVKMIKSNLMVIVVGALLQRDATGKRGLTHAQEAGAILAVVTAVQVPAKFALKLKKDVNCKSTAYHYIVHTSPSIKCPAPTR